MKGPLLMLIALALCSLGCESNRTAVEAWPSAAPPYTFDAPDVRFELEKDLEEISGIAVMDDGRLAAIQDEEGILFVLDPASGRIVERRSFGGRADYEAVAIAQGALFVLESNGTLHRFDAWDAAEFEGEEIDLDLPSRCDSEGLRYDPSGDRLLVSCKDEPGDDLERERAIYAFGLDGAPMSETPVFVLDTRTFTASVEDHPVNEAVRSVLSERVDLSGFRPSDLAVHPVTGDIYVLSSVREAIVALRPDGEVVGVWSLLDSLLDQPEGLDFEPNGDLYLTSEAADGKEAVLLRYSYRGSQQNQSE